MPWLACSTSGKALCKVCVDGGCGRDTFALGAARLLLPNIRRHAKSKSHEKAVIRWNERAVGDSGCVVTNTPAADVSFVLPRVLVETRGSFRDFANWASNIEVGPLPALKRRNLNREDAKEAVATMAGVEGDVTHAFLQAADALALAADGLGRTYQVTTTIVVWKFPNLPWLLQPGLKFPWLQTLGERGPWLVQRLIGARELPAELDTDGKAAEVRECVRRAVFHIPKENEVDMFGAVCNRVLSWASDGADRSVGELAVRDFKNMAFREWEESHSGVKLLPHALAADEEVSLVERLLLAVAKFLSTSDVFRRRFGDSLLKSTVAWVQNFGWAPQRYTSRSRPLSREARRWDPIFESLCEEAGSAGERGQNAWHLVRELSGVNSPRLLLGGMLTDIAVEHYDWVAGGDKLHPDPTTATDRANLFLDRLGLLFDEGMVLTMADTYTGSVMKFLQKGKLFQVRGHSLCVGLGDPADPDVKNIVATVLKKARQIVANIRVYMCVYRNPKGWLYRFRAFRFPSPLRPSAPAEDKKEAIASLTHIQRVAGLSNRAIPELLQLLPRATFHAQSVDSAKAAWGRSSAEFPELKDGRSAVNCLLAFEPYTGNLERRFRVFREQKNEERARMLDATVEQLLLVEFAPPSAAMRAALAAHAPDSRAMRTYMEQLAKKQVRKQFRVQQKERRDAHLPRDKIAQESRLLQLGAPESDAAFARKRKFSIGNMLRASPQERVRLRSDNVWSEVAAVASAEAVVVSPAVKQKARQLTEKTRQLTESSKKKDKVIRAFVGDRSSGHSESKSAPPGVALVRATDVAAVAQAKKQGFVVTSDALEFIEKVLSARARTPRKEHVVLVTPAAVTDFAVAARLVSAFLGTYRADPAQFLKREADCGCAFAPRYNRKGACFQAAVSASFIEAFPTAVSALRRLATAPGSRVELMSETRLKKAFRAVSKRSAGADAREAPAAAHKRMRLFSNCPEQERQTAKKKHKALYSTVDDYLSSADISKTRDSVCPGFF